MPYSNEWLQFCKAEDEYLNNLHALMQNEERMIDDLDIALSLADDNETALRFLLGMTPKLSVVLPLVSKIVNLSVDSSNLSTIELSRAVLHLYKDDSSIKTNIKNSIISYLAYNDDWHYRRIAELYKLMGYEKELNSFVILCQANENLEIQEIGNDFNHIQN